MGSRERREREKSELREKILDAAREMFATDGVEATTMRRIAERIEYSPTAIYLHFADKDTLLRELCTSDFAQLAQQFAALSSVKDPVERLRLLGESYAELGLTHPHAYRLMFMTPKTNDPGLDGKDIGNPQTDAYAFLLMTVKAAIDAGALKPEHSDPELVAQTVWAALHGVVALHLGARLHGPYKWRPFKQRVHAMVELAIGGLARTPTTTRPRKRVATRA